MTINDKVATRIKEIRESKRMLQRQVAESLAMSESAYSRLEAGKTHINIDTIYRLSEIFECSINEILVNVENGQKNHGLDAFLLSELKNLVQKITGGRSSANE